MSECPYSIVKEKIKNIPSIINSNNSDEEKAKLIGNCIYHLYAAEHYPEVSGLIKTKIEAIKYLHDSKTEDIEYILEIANELYTDVEKLCCK